MAEPTVQIVAGPPSKTITKEIAERKLRSHPQFPKNATVTLDDVEGRWIAAIVESDAPPFLPKDEEETEAPEPASEAEPKDEAEPKEDKPEPPKEEGPKDEKGGDVKAQLAHLTDLLTKVVTALGLDSPEESPVPEELSDVPPPPAKAKPSGPTGPGKGPGGGISQRPMRPGDSPPGSTPIGAPAFAKVRDDHPWKEAAAQVASFTVEEEIGDQPLSKVERELQSLASEVRLNVRRLQEGRTEDGKRTAKAIISRH